MGAETIPEPLERQARRWLASRDAQGMARTAITPSFSALVRASQSSKCSNPSSETGPPSRRRRRSVGAAAHGALPLEPRWATA